MSLVDHSHHQRLLQLSRMFQPFLRNILQWFLDLVQDDNEDYEREGILLEQQQYHPPAPDVPFVPLPGGLPADADFIRRGEERFIDQIVTTFFLPPFSIQSKYSTKWFD